MSTNSITTSTIISLEKDVTNNIYEAIFKGYIFENLNLLKLFKNKKLLFQLCKFHFKDQNEINEFIINNNYTMEKCEFIIL